MDFSHFFCSMVEYYLYLITANRIETVQKLNNLLCLPNEKIITLDKADRMLSVLLHDYKIQNLTKIMSLMDNEKNF